MKAKITKRNVDSTEATKATGAIMLWDTEVSGFGIRFWPTGGKIYQLKARVNGKQRWFTIGRHGSPWTAEEARKEAIRLLGDIAAGNDPANKRAEDKAAIDMKELCTLYLAEGCAMKKASTLSSDQGRINRHIIAHPYYPKKAETFLDVKAKSACVCGRMAKREMERYS